jgi:HSP20 family protein
LLPGNLIEVQVYQLKEVPVMSNLRLFEPVMNDSLESMFKRFMAPMRLELDNGSLEMRVDINEANGAYKVRADLPGVKKEDINVRIDGNIVQIDAEVKQEKETKDKAGKVLRSERYQGAVSRTFSLPQDVDDAKATAKYDDGVLTLELPKKPGKSTKRLAIQ